MTRAVVCLLVFASVAGGCLGPEGASTTSVPGPVVAPSVLRSDAVVSYLHDLSPILPGIRLADAIVEHHRIAAVDGVALDTWVLRPPIEERVPIVLEATPYYGGGSPFDDPAVAAAGPLYWPWWNVLVPRGYAVAITSVRGTGNSEGCFTIGGPEEAKDTAAVIEALAAEPWSNGRVGMIGASYPGTTQQDVWVEAPPSLKTIVPVAAISDLYKYNFVNGVPIVTYGYSFNLEYWVLVGLGPSGLNGGHQALDPSSVPTSIVGEACTDQVDVQEGGASSAVDGDKDEYWQARDFLRELRESPARDRASVFYIHGMGDWNVKPHHMEDWLDAVQDSGVPFKAWLGQWTHDFPGPVNGTQSCRKGDACRDDFWTQALLAWFDEFLKERSTGVLDAPAVQVQDTDGLWRHEVRWPPTDVTAWTLHPNAEGRLEGSPSSGSVAFYDYAGNPVQGNGPADATPPQPVAAALGPDRVEWVSQPLTDDARISGQPSVTAHVTASGARATIVFTLVERTDAGDRYLNWAIQSLNHVKSVEQGEEDVSGRIQQVSVRFFPQEDVVHRGSRLVLVAAGNALTGGSSGGASPHPVSSGSTITIDLAGAGLTLPVDDSLVFEDPQPYV